MAARAYLLVDVTSGQVLASKDADQAVEPASLTKLMTAYIVFDALKTGKLSLTQTFGVSERAWKMPGSRMFIDPRCRCRWRT
ncbi:D-alanyl-D-alanine carboxypeptidase DacC precursor [Hydrogenophaga sp. T4]|nr:D-alanyl-D-alanine carboxypeptidase DacC precursor [Hydrogenophaga sp. T4]